MPHTHTETLQRAFHWFLPRIGYATPPGRAQCALNLARAEARLLASDLEFHTQQDEERAYCYCYNPECLYHEGSKGDWETVVAYIVRPCPDHGLDCRHANTLQSLCGIMAPDADYLRIIRAELASELDDADFVTDGELETEHVL